MNSELQVAVITGAASGIGLALARACAMRGIHVVMADNDVSALCDQVEQLAADVGTEVLGVVCDVVKPESIRHLLRQTCERFNRIDLLFNNAGICGHLAPVWELTPEHIRKVIDINLFGVINGIQAFLPIMFKQAHSSHIINMASFYGLCSGSQLAAYAMSKHGIVALSESLYFDLRRLQKNVSVSVVCPSFANTQLLANSAPLHHDPFHTMLSDLITRSRSAEDIAEHILSEVGKGTFYILPDREVKEYCEQRTKAIIEQQEPHCHSLEKIITSLSARAVVKG